MYAQKPVQYIPFQPRYCRERLRWCKEHISWGHQQWSRAMFSDESRYAVTSDSGQQPLWTDREIFYAQQYVRERDQYDPGFLV